MEFLTPSLCDEVQKCGQCAVIEVDIVESIFNISDKNKEEKTEKIISFLQKDDNYVYIDLVKAAVCRASETITKIQNPLLFLKKKLKENFFIDFPSKMHLGHYDIIQCLEDDDLDTFADFYNNKGANKIKYEYNGIKSLFELCCVLGAVKCFKFMVENLERINNKVALAAIEGNNSEIIRIIEQNGYQFSDCLNTCIKFHRYDVLEWIQLSKTHETVNYIDALNAFAFPLILTIPKEANLHASEIAQYGFSGFFELYPNTDELNKIFRTAIYYNHYNVIKFFINNHNRADIQSALDYSLFETVLRKHFDKLEYLIKNGANIKAKNQFGESLLCYAMHISSLEGFKALLNVGCDVNEITEDGDSLLHTAINYHETEIVYFLVEKGIFNEQRNKAGDTPFQLAAKNREGGAIEAFASINYDINKKIVDGKTALHIAASSGDLFITMVLIKNGAFTDIKDDFGKTPLDYATETVSGFINSHQKSHVREEANKEEGKDNA